jgi:hypothetical protein
VVPLIIIYYTVPTGLAVFAVVFAFHASTRGTGWVYLPSTSRAKWRVATSLGVVRDGTPGRGRRGTSTYV